MRRTHSYSVVREAEEMGRKQRSTRLAWFVIVMSRGDQRQKEHIQSIDRWCPYLSYLQHQFGILDNFIVIVFILHSVTTITTITPTNHVGSTRRGSPSGHLPLVVALFCISHCPVFTSILTDQSVSLGGEINYLLEKERFKIIFK